MAKRILCLFFALMMIASGAMAVNMDRFRNDPNFVETISDDEWMFTFGEEGSQIMGGYSGSNNLGMLVVMLKCEDNYIPTSITITTDTKVYTVTGNALISLLGDTQGYLLIAVNKEAADMLHDISASNDSSFSYTHNGIKHNKEFDPTSKHVLDVFYSEFTEEIATLPERYLEEVELFSSIIVCTEK